MTAGVVIGRPLKSSSEPRSTRAIYRSQLWGVFTLWDRLFRTFQNELAKEPVVFSLREPLKSSNPIWAKGHIYWRLILDCWQTNGLLSKLSLTFRPPGWRSPGDTTYCQSERRNSSTADKLDPQITRFGKIYVFGQFGVNIGLALYVMINVPTWG